MVDPKQYDVALSFAGEQRPFVNAVAELLREAGVSVFYDDYEKVELWGKDLYEHLDYVYRKASRYCVVFVSAAYAQKVWTNHERRSAQARAIEENQEYVLPARFDDTELPGLRPTVGYISLTSTTPDELSLLIQQKLGPRQAAPIFPKKLDRLYKALDIRPIKSKHKGKRKEARDAAYGLYEALGRMTTEERTAVAGVFAFGCPFELPRGVHISLDLLSRMTKLSKVELVNSLSAIRSLGFQVYLREWAEVHPAGRGELQPDDKDVLLHFWTSRAPDAADATLIAQHAVQKAVSHFCADHGLEYIVARDFRLLSREELHDLIEPSVAEIHVGPNANPQMAGGECTVTSEVLD